ncbi:cytochrome P450 [Hyaloscypha sp. PMI_1271]|nr:cytochrome P450 [Hyaloscypha sp. PMI_1271]
MEKYRIQRRVVGPAYTADAMKDLEPNLDQILKKDIGIMKERAGQVVDLDLFLNLLTSDCLSIVTFSTANSLVENGDDGSIAAVHKAWKYMLIAGFFPWFHRLVTWFSYNPKTNLLKKLFSSVLDHRLKRSQDLGKSDPFAHPRTQVQSRLASRDSDSGSNDVMAKMLQLQADKGALKDPWVVSMCMGNFGAGVETTAITIGALIHNIVSHPGCQERVHREIDQARREGKLSDPPKLREMQENLSFLSACLSESARLHGVVGMPLVRVVPQGGVDIEGVFLPGGTTIGINPWVLGRDKSLYGEDAEDWRPERWLEYSREKLRHLETCSLTWGAGSRTCPGKHLAQAIYHKLIPMLLDFEWNYADPDAEKVLQCTFSVRYTELKMRWKVRGLEK